MMQIIGNIFLLLSLFFGALLFKMAFLQKMPGGDYGVGYAWSVLVLMATFWGCIAVIACIIGFGGGFEWLSLGRFAGGGKLLLCFLVMVVGANLGMETSFKSIPLLPTISAVATPVVLMAVFAVLLNGSLKTVVSPTHLKWGLGLVLATNCLVLASMMARSVTSKVAMLLPRRSNELTDFQLGMLKRIETCDVSKGITQLFGYCGSNQPPQIRDAAVLKITSKPGWQEDLYNSLEGDEVDNAFAFLLAHEVDDRPRFAKGVYQGVLSEARLIRESLRRTSHPSHVYNGKFGYEIERSLQVVEKFKDLGVDYKPAVQELRAALDEPIDFDNPNPSCKRILDKWLKNH